ncbi:hypothetical protein TNIN_72741 [Trichonephila inaurata madagascariensis]|uniref:Uncharacterized protein n=1 Tax=Trichonephila inaurata madagascariensis TaxID=2747483 RepID=A0A8X6X192_9ARAC|nr:hypothetical protein TNIN_72741 [Trichonephila inaurata madagascariensis]
MSPRAEGDGKSILVSSCSSGGLVLGGGLSPDGCQPYLRLGHEITFRVGPFRQSSRRRGDHQFPIQARVRRGLAMNSGLTDAAPVFRPAVLHPVVPSQVSLYRRRGCVPLKRSEGPLTVRNRARDLL